MRSSENSSANDREMFAKNFFLCTGAEVDELFVFHNSNSMTNTVRRVHRTANRRVRCSVALGNSANKPNRANNEQCERFILFEQCEQFIF